MTGTSVYPKFIPCLFTIVLTGMLGFLSAAANAAGLPNTNILTGTNTAKMVQLLQQVHDNIEPMETMFESRRRVPILRDKFNAAVRPRDKVSIGSAYGLELLNNGQALEAIQQLEAILTIAKSS